MESLTPPNKISIIQVEFDIKKDQMKIQSTLAPVEYKGLIIERGIPLNIDTITERGEVENEDTIEETGLYNQYHFCIDKRNI